MAICKSCQINLSKSPRSYSYPKDIPISPDMKSVVDKLRRDDNVTGSKGGRQGLRK